MAGESGGGRSLWIGADRKGGRGALTCCGRGKRVAKGMRDIGCGKTTDVGNGLFG